MPEPQPERRWSADDLQALVNNEDLFTLAIKGHEAVVQVIDLAIAEMLSPSHSVELRSLSAALKIDLATGLGAVPETERAPLRKLNAIRNAFAHDSATPFGWDEARDYFNTWSDWFRRGTSRGSIGDFESPHDVLSHGVAVSVVVLEICVRELRDTKAHAEISMELTREALSGRPRQRREMSIQEDVEDRIRSVRQKREDTGRL